MRIFTYKEAIQHVAEVFNIAQREEVLIKRRGGGTYRLTYATTSKSPFDVPSVKTKARTKDMLNAIRESRSRNR